MILPQVNATLLSIATPGSRRSYGRTPGADAPPKWAGEADAYLRERVRSTLAGTAEGDLTRAKVSNLIIPGDLHPPVQISAGDHVTYRIDNQETGEEATITREVADITAPQPPPGVYEFTVNIALTNAAV